jgi:cell division protein FtsB
MVLLHRFLRLAFLFALLMVAVITVPIKVFDHQGIERVEVLKRELEALKYSNQRIASDNEVLRRQIGAIHSDPEYIEKIARDELGMVQLDEVIYQFPNEGL